MRTGIGVLNYEIDDVQVVQHKAKGPIRSGDCSVGAQRHFTENGGHERHIVGDVVEQSAVCAVSHEGEVSLEKVSKSTVTMMWVLPAA